MLPQCCVCCGAHNCRCSLALDFTTYMQNQWNLPFWRKAVFSVKGSSRAEAGPDRASLGASCAGWAGTRRTSPHTTRARPAGRSVPLHVVLASQAKKSVAKSKCGGPLKHDKQLEQRTARGHVGLASALPTKLPSSLVVSCGDEENALTHFRRAAVLRR